MKSKSMKVTLGILVAAGFTLSGCNTIQGIGKDVQSVGKGVEKTSDAVRKEIKKDDDK